MAQLQIHICYCYTCIRNTLSDIQYDICNTILAKTGNKLNVHQ